MALISVKPACLGPPALSQVLPDREGKRCMFCVKTASRTYEMSASDTRQRQEWTAGECWPGGLGLAGAQSPHLCKGSDNALPSGRLETELGGPARGPPSPRLVLPDLPPAAIQTAIRLQAEGKTSLHKDLKQKRREQREQRERRRAAKEEELLRLQQLQEEKERKLQELELLQEAQRQAERLLQEEEERRRSQHRELQQALEGQLREAEQVGPHPRGRGGLRDAGRRGLGTEGPGRGPGRGRSLWAEACMWRRGLE